MENSLSKKNGVEITTGAGVNPAFPSKQFKKIQKLDREISKLENQRISIMCLLYPHELVKINQKIEKLDLKRKLARSKKV